MQVVTVAGDARSGLGKRSTKDDRAAGLVPGVIYGGGEVIHFTTTAKKVKSLIYTNEFKVAEIEVDGQTHRAILKDMQFHPVTERLLHVDFLKLVDEQPIRVEVPIRFEGTSPGVKNGGKLQQNIRRVKIKTTPENLVDEMVVDVSSLILGQSVRIKDIKEVDGVEVTNSPGIPIATVVVPRAMRSLAEDELEEGEGEEGEVEEGAEETEGATEE